MQKISKRLSQLLESANAEQNEENEIIRLGCLHVLSLITADGN